MFFDKVNIFFIQLETSHLRTSDLNDTAFEQTNENKINVQFVVTTYGVLLLDIQ